MSGGRVALVLNPVSRRAAQARLAVERCCAAAGLDPLLVLPTTVEDPGPGQARYAVAQGVGRVVVAGGDGTVRLVAGELARATGRLAAAGGVARCVTLGVVPVGTANLFARSAGLPVRDLGAAARLAVTGEGRPTDLGRAEVRGAGGELGGHPFLVVGGLGHDAATLAAVTPEVKDRVRWLAYFLPGLQRLRSPGHRLSVSADGRALEVGPLWSLLAVNAARLPAGARVVPGARLDDGVLHLVLVSPSGLGGWLRVARAGLSRSGEYPQDDPALSYRAAREVVVRPDAPVAAQVDGDVLEGVVSATFRVEPGALLVARAR